MEAQEAYDEAVTAIFVLQVDCHRHVQPHAKHNGKVRWEMIEMWPMQVSILQMCSLLDMMLCFLISCSKW